MLFTLDAGSYTDGISCNSRANSAIYGQEGGTIQLALKVISAVHTTTSIIKFA